MTERLCEFSGLGLLKDQMAHLNAEYLGKAFSAIENNLIRGMLADYKENLNKFDCAANDLFPFSDNL